MDIYFTVAISFIAGNALDDFPFARNISSQPNQARFKSCRDRCLETSSRSNMLECKCDRACMFLGDCCYDYLLECDPRQLELSTALREQYHKFQRFRPYSNCVLLQLRGQPTPKLIRMINDCPDGLHKDNGMHLMCTGLSDRKTLSSYIPVLSDGVLFLNMYCAACHGLPLHQLTPVAYRGIECDSNKNLKLLPFENQPQCKFFLLDIKPAFNYLERYRDTCECKQVLPLRVCSDPIYEMECSAYSNIVFDAYNQSYNNKACLACNKDGTNHTQSQSNCKLGCRGVPLIKLFDFTGISVPRDHVCEDYYNRGQSGNPCLIKRCQDDFEVHNNKCLSSAAAQACYPTRQNRFKTNFQIANLFRSTVILYYKPLLSVGAMHIFRKLPNLNKSTTCSDLPEIYNDVLPKNLPTGILCTVLYFDSMAFANMSWKQTKYNKADKGLVMGIEAYYTVLLNHDPLSNISCTGGVTVEYMTHFQIMQGPIVQVRSRNTKQEFLSNRDPMVMLYKSGSLNMEMLAFVCEPEIDKMNCSERLGQEMSSPLNSCLKYELTDGIQRGNETFLLKSGKILKQEDIILTHNDTILICVALYDKLHKTNNNNLLVVTLVGYSVSLVCLLTTFIIYSRYSDLRTLPGLMLMNLVGALFCAQLLYVMNIWGLFTLDPIICQVMASAQHYFWLVSFAWMTCMSLDIFRCFSPASMTVNTYTTTKYMKYVLVSWLLPLVAPLTSNVLSNSPGSTLTYSTSKSCWLSDAEGVLYLFAIPVITSVCTNIVLFIGSVCRLCASTANASLVGRKEDNKKRLVQCLKLSSWMGISWLFGIVPNFVDVEALWYAFSVANAMQGIHIFISFGISGRARILINSSRRGNENENSTSETSTQSKFTSSLSLGKIDWRDVITSGNIPPSYIVQNTPTIKLIHQPPVSF